MVAITHVTITVDIDFTGKDVFIGVLFEVLGNIGGYLWNYVPHISKWLRRFAETDAIYLLDLGSLLSFGIGCECILDLGEPLAELVLFDNRHVTLSQFLSTSMKNDQLDVKARNTHLDSRSRTASKQRPSLCH